MSKSAATQTVNALLSQGVDTLTEKQLQALDALIKVELGAKSLAKSLYETLDEETKSSNRVKNYIDELDISEEKKEALYKLYTSTILLSLDKAQSAIYKKIINSEQPKEYSYLYTLILSETLITIMDGILAFEKGLDSMFPKASDKLLDVISSSLSLAITAFEPTIGLLVQASGIIKTSTDFLKPANLENNIQKMREDLAQIKENKNLDKLRKSSHLMDAPQEELCRIFQDDIKIITSLGKMANKHPETKKDIQDLCEYTEKYVPTNEEELNQNFSKLKKEILEDLAEHDVAPKTQEKISAAIDEEKAFLLKSLQEKDKIFDRMADINTSANSLENKIKDIKTSVRKKNRNAKILAPEISEKLTSSIDTCLRGNIDDATRLVKNPQRLSTNKNIERIKEITGINRQNKESLSRKQDRAISR